MARISAQLIALATVSVVVFASGCQSNSVARGSKSDNLDKVLQCEVRFPMQVLCIAPPDNLRSVSLPELLCRLQHYVQSNTTYDLEIYVEPELACVSLTNDNPQAVTTLVVPVASMELKDILSVCICCPMEAEWVRCDGYILLRRKNRGHPEVHPEM